MEDGSSVPLWGILILMFLIWFDGILYGFSAAMQNLSEGDLEKKAQSGDPKSQKLLDLTEHPERLDHAIPLTVVATGLSLGYFLLPMLISSLPVPAASWALALAMVLVVLLIASLGILTFRRVGTFHPERFAYRYLGIVSLFLLVLQPFTWLIDRLSRVAAVPLGVGFHQAPEEVTEEEIISMVDEAHEQGVIEENEAEMIQNIISFNETEAGDIMTHRMNVVAFDEQALLQEVVDRMLEEGNSRYPVYRENLDNIVGIIHYKDALKFLTKNSWAKFQPLAEMPGLIRKANFIPETRGIGDLFHTMQARKIHMAIVVDEYGQTAGIVSMEDILEEIVGEILDEYDEEEETIRRQIDNSIVIDGLADLDDVEDRLGITFENCEFETLNGFLTSILGHIPTKKDLDKVIVANGYSFRIISLGNKTIGKVKAEKLNQ